MSDPTTRDTAALCVPVPVDLLRKVAELVTCEAHGAWCWNHEASSWPCPMARLMQYVPEEADRD
jgi:hypothetical protein